MKLKYIKFSYIKFFKKNISAKYILNKSFFKYLFFWLKGFENESIELYMLNKNNYKFYLPDCKIPKITLNTNKYFWPILHDKLFFYSFIKDKLPTPEIFGIIQDGKIIDCKSKYNLNDLLLNLDSSGKLVLKPFRSGFSDGVLFLKGYEKKYFLQNIPVKKEELIKSICKLNNYGIFKFYDQHSSISSIFPNSINTIRLITCIHNKEAFIFSAVLRIGTKKSEPYDALFKGGITSLIDYDTGMLSEYKGRDNYGNFISGINHPDSNSRIEGTIVPYWQDIKATMLLFLDDFPILNFVGWDILVTNNGFQVIEGNHNPNLVLTQIHKPYLMDKRVKDFFIKNKII